MSAEIQDDANGNVLTTNFDTYTLILQLGCILNTVRTWKKAYILRVAVFVEYETDVTEERARVMKLLDNLRIQAEVIVVWLASGELQSYEIIVNGATPGHGDGGKLERLLEEEVWWRELQERRRNPSKDASPSVEIRGLSNLDTPWPSSSFQQLGRSDVSHSSIKRLGLHHFKNSAKRRSISGLAMLGISATMNMRTQRLQPDALHHGSESEGSSSDDDVSIAGSAASADDINAYSDDDRIAFSFGKQRRASTSNELAAAGGWTTGVQRKPVARRPAPPPPPPSAPPAQKDGMVIASSSSSTTASSTTAKDNASLSGSKFLSPTVSKLRLASRPATPSFSCKAIPDTELATDDGPGPSIMFAESSNQGARQSRNMDRPLGSAVSFSFNDLPSRGQHLILNELMKRYSENTAVLFTTLPSPPPNTCKSESDSLAYLEGLEVFAVLDLWLSMPADKLLQLLTDGLPPSLLIHSNSLCVTTAL